MTRVTILGWKRNKMPELLKICEDLSSELAKMDFDIITGGGGGFMEAANKGAYNVERSKSISYGVYGLQEINNFTDAKYKYTCENFAIRKSMLLDATDYLIFFPGGVGTLDEFMDTINLYKTNMRRAKPIICVGNKYWNSLKDWFKANEQDFPHQYVSLISEDVNEILDFIKSDMNFD